MSEGDPIRVLLADDHTMFRQGIARVLSGYGGMEIVGQADNDDGAVELARRTRPDVVLMQVQMPISRAKVNLRRMREATDPPPKVVIVTMIEDPRHVRELMTRSERLHRQECLRRAPGGRRARRYPGPEEQACVVGMPLGMLEEAQEGSQGVLSARELEILLLAARGLSNRQIGAALYVTEGTVKRHLANTYEKMGSAPEARPPGRRSSRSGSPSRTSPTTGMGPNGPTRTCRPWALPAAIPSRQPLGLLKDRKQLVQETSRSSEVVPSSSIVASMRSVMSIRTRHTTPCANARGSPASSASCTSTCGLKRSASPSRKPGARAAPRSPGGGGGWRARSPPCTGAAR